MEFLDQLEENFAQQEIGSHYLVSGNATSIVAVIKVLNYSNLVLIAAYVLMRLLLLAVRRVSPIQYLSEVQQHYSRGSFGGILLLTVTWALIKILYATHVIHWDIQYVYLYTYMGASGAQMASLACYPLAMLFLLLGVMLFGYVHLHDYCLVKDRSQLITDGPYSFSRHPMYTSMLSFKIGTALFTLDVVLMALLALMFFLVSLRLKDYERSQIARYGDAYIAFLRVRGPLVPCACLGLSCMGLNGNDPSLATLQPMVQETINHELGSIDEDNLLF